MVETRRSSSSSKRTLSSSPPSSILPPSNKRSKGVEAASSSTSGDPIVVKDCEQEEVRSVDDPALKDSLKEDDKVTVGGHVDGQDGQPLVSPMTLGLFFAKKI
ncbi:hypothetical protein Tco_1204928 [Tanacetum coccineum]